MGIISTLIKTGLVAGAGITALQASAKAKREADGKPAAQDYLRSFGEQARENSRLVIDTIKSKLGGGDGYRYSDKGENGYSYNDPSSGRDKVNEVFETMKEKAPEVIGKVQDFVEDVREHAPEYKEKAQDFVEDVKEAAKKVIEKKDE